MKPKGAEKRDTRDLIVQDFCAKVRTMPLSKLRIGDLIKDLGINRNTFYYYFTSKADVAIYAFRSDIDRRLRNVYPASELVTEAGSDDPFAGLAFYGRTEVGARMLDHNKFVVCLADCIIEDKALYRNLFTWSEIDFVQYVRSIWRYALADDIEVILDGRYMSDDVKDLLAGYGSNALIGIAFFAVMKSDKTELFDDDRINPFNNLVLESIHDSIQRHPLNRLGSRTPPQRKNDQYFFVTK